MKRILIVLGGLIFVIHNISYAQQCKEKTIEVLRLKGTMIKDSIIIRARNAVCVCKKEGDTLHYVISLSTLSEVYNGTSLKDSCLKYAKKACDIYRQSTLKSDFLQGWLTQSLGNAYQNQGFYNDALSNYNEASVIFERNLKASGSQSVKFLEFYLQCQNDIALNFIYTQQYTKAKNQFDSLFKYLTDYNASEAKIILTRTNYASYLDFMGEYEQALNYNKENLVRYKNYIRSNPVDYIFYSQLLNNLGYSYQQLGFYQYAYPYYQESFDIKKKLYNEYDESYLKALNNIGASYLNLRRNDEALQIFKKLYNLKGVIDINSRLYTDILSNLVVAYSNVGEKLDALEVSKQLVDIKRKSRLQEPADFASALAILGNVYRESGNYKKAIEILKEASNLYQLQSTKSYNPEAFIVKNNLGSAYIATGRYSEAIDLYKKLLEIGDQRFRLAYLNNLIASYAGNNEMSKALIYFKEAVIATRMQMQNRIGILSNYEKEKYVIQLDELFHIYKSFLADVPTSSKLEYNSMVYNNELLLKGFIVSNEQKMRRSIIESGDSILINQYNIWKDSKLRLFHSEIRNDIGTESDLKMKTAEAERQLASRSKIFDQEISFTNIDLNQIQSKLSDNEIIVDFFFYREYSKKLKPSGNFMYGAFLLKKGYKYPLWIPLCSEKQLSKLLDSNKSNDIERDRINSIYGDMDINASNSLVINAVNENLFKLIWQPILPYLRDISRIFFIPVKRLGALSLLALHDNKDFLLDKYQFIQLQNAKDVLDHESFDNFGRNFKSIVVGSQESKAALFGGIEYNYKQTSLDSLNSASIDSTNFYSDLPLTELEVKEIYKLMHNSGIDVKVIDSLKSTEDYFKSFDKDSPEIIHIATHGFFNPVSDIVDINKVNISADQIFKFSKNPFLRAGLLFTYGNYTLGGGKFSDGREDGILTAEEISLLDLSHTNLLVLSACETGVGDIVGSEGIFGLQRSFKIAGVRHMIVSLWKVSEKATKKFMEIFYQQFLDGKGIYIAFQETQKIMKKTYNPYFWAGFVLV